jgi:hypothetical protein
MFLGGWAVLGFDSRRALRREPETTARNERGRLLRRAVNVTFEVLWSYFEWSIGVVDLTIASLTTLECP